jgi:hypothetical protein
MEQMYNEGAIKAETTRRQKLTAQTRTSGFRQRKVQEAKADYDRRMGEERQAREELEREVMEMELLEMELIKKLQNT